MQPLISLIYLFLQTAADCPMTACNRADLSGERLYKSPRHSLIASRFLKSQPLPGHSTIGRELDHRLIQSQPATHSGSPRLVQTSCILSLNSQSLFLSTMSLAVNVIVNVIVHTVLYNLNVQCSLKCFNMFSTCKYGGIQFYFLNLD